MPRVVAALDAAGIPSMLTGSLASSLHGVPRATQNVDLVIEATHERLEALARYLPPAGWYFDVEGAKEALNRETQFNVLDFASNWNVDCIIRKSRPFSRAEFDRRQRVSYEGRSLFVATAEDVILAKLEWSRLGGSARQIEDASGIIQARREDLDLGWIFRWIPELGIESQWSEACRLAGFDPRPHPRPDGTS